MNTRDARPQPLLGEADATGLAHLYRLLLGREAEPAVLAAAQPRPLQALIGEMAASAEIDRTVLHALVQQRPLPHETLDAARLAEAGRWFAAVAEGRDTDAPPVELPQAAQVLAEVLAHPVVSACLLDAHGSLFTEAWPALQARARQAALRLAGRIEFANQECISGWALRQGAAATGPLLLEIRHQGRLVASAVACSHRPDIQHRLGGDGLVGFRARWQPDALPAGGSVWLTLHDAASGTTIGTAYRHEHSVADQLGVAQLLAREFDELQRRLDALAGLVPQALGYAALPLARFDLYRRLHRVPMPPPLGAAPAPTVAVLLDASRAGPRALRTSVDSLRALAPGVPWQAWVVADGGDTADALAAAAAADPRLHALAGADEALARLAAPSGPAWLFLLDAGESLDPQALAWVAHAAAATADDPPCLVFWDEDQVDHHGAQAPSRLPRHRGPVLRTRFDPHAMLELNVVGHSFAVQAAALRKAAGRLAAGDPGDHPLSPGQREALVWSLTRDGRFEHLPHFLLTRTDAVADEADSAVPLARLAACAEPAQLKALLPAAWRQREWQRVPDPLAPALGKPLVHWRPQHARAPISVLVPTRDHAELVQQCLGSLRQLADEPGAVEFIVADNGSTDEATLDYLAAAEAAGDLRLLRIDEPFNWSRLSNRLAEAARGDHLLFLNDDTRMLTRGWDTVLRGQLEDPQVGAVGARLFYEDMTVQHAGVRFGQEGFLGHIAVGQSPEAVEGFPASQLTREVSAVTGAFLACRRGTWQHVGPFDEQRLAVTYNDVDWCMRVRRAGLKVLYTPALSLIHCESKSRGFDFLSGAKQQRADHERLQLLRLHPEGFAHDPFHPPALHAWTPHVTSL